VAARDKLETLAGDMLEADDQVKRGQLSVADHEMTWWRVYEQMDSGYSAGMHRTGQA
jgi:hypothetical protein